MPKQIIKRAQTSKIVRLFIQDATSTTGAGLTGLTNSSAGLVAYYIREGDATPTAITLAAGTIGTWSSGGFIQVDSVNLPGVYELGLPNAALSSGNSVLVMLKGATNMVPCVAEWELDAYDPQDAAALGLSRLDVAVGTRNATTPPTAVQNRQEMDTNSTALAALSSGQVTINNNVLAVPAAVWAVSVRTLSSFGTLVADVATAVWGAATRTLSAFGFTPTVGGYASGQDPVSLLNVAQAGNFTPVVNSPLDRIYKVAAAVGVSKVSVSADGLTGTFYWHDGTTVAFTKTYPSTIAAPLTPPYNVTSTG